MIAVGATLGAPSAPERAVAMPAGMGWAAPDPLIRAVGATYRAGRDPRSLVDPAIWTGPAIHVDGVSGDDSRSGLGAADGDFGDAVRTIHAAFSAGNLTGGAYRVIVRAGRFAESAFTRNGRVEPAFPVAILGWGGPVIYRTGPFAVDWTLSGGLAHAAVSGVKRVFRTDLCTDRGHFTELARVVDEAACRATPESWCETPGGVAVNRGDGAQPGPEDLALLRGFHGARFLSHAADLYLEDIHCEGGITGTLHCDAEGARNLVAVGCSFRYAAPSSPAAPADAVRVRRLAGLAAFFGCDASFGAKDGWSFHEDGTPGLHVLLSGCTGHDNGAPGAQSCNAVTTHDGVRAVIAGGRFGLSRNGTEMHFIQDTRTWIAGARAQARDVDGSSVAYKCSNAGRLWLEDAVADAAGGDAPLAVEANGGTVGLRRFRAISGGVAAYSGGSVGPF